MKKNHKRTNVPYASGGYRTRGIVIWSHVKPKVTLKTYKRTKKGALYDQTDILDKKDSKWQQHILWKMLPQMPSLQTLPA